jgi:hypothetical protein
MARPNDLVIAVTNVSAPLQAAIGRVILITGDYEDAKVSYNAARAAAREAHNRETEALNAMNLLQTTLEAATQDMKERILRDRKAHG